MKKFSCIPLFLTLLLIKGIVACTEPINLTGRAAAPVPVITCTLSTDTMAYSVLVQKSAAYFGNALPYYVPDAKVWLNTEQLQKGDRVGEYKTREDFYGVPGQTYFLEVRCDWDDDGVEERYTATTTIPPRTYRLDSVTVSPIQAGKDFPALLSLHYKGSAEQDYFGAALFVEDHEFDIAYSNRLLRYCLFPLDLFGRNGRDEHVQADWLIRHELPYDNNSKYRLYAGDVLTVELHVLSKEYHDFLSAAKTEASQNNPLFSGPRANVPSNFTGGALGVFGSYTYSHASVQLPADTPDLPQRPSDARVKQENY